MASKNLKGAVIDTGILIDYYTRKLGIHQEYIEYIEREIFENTEFERFFISFLTKTELLYINSRLKGWNDGKKYVDDLLAGYVVVRNEELDDLAASLKCRLPISLTDCYVISAGRLLDIPVYFSEEKELAINVQKGIRDDFEVDLHIISKFGNN